MFYQYIKQGTVILRVKAEDGDKGIPRSVNYGVMTDSSPFAPFFIMDPFTGKTKTITLNISSIINRNV